MIPIFFGSICGVAFGTLAVLLMLPMSFPDKRTALSAAFASRFAIGFIVPAAHLPMPMPMAGALIGLLVSLPDAIVTKAYAPIIIIGTGGGGVIGYLSGVFAA
jgi:hypothetical protein